MGWVYLHSSCVPLHNSGLVTDNKIAEFKEGTRYQIILKLNKINTVLCSSGGNVCLLETKRNDNCLWAILLLEKSYLFNYNL